MSLVVCSNKQDSREYERFGEDQASYRFRNHLKYGVEIPENSEVAVQSVKINKDGLIKISDFSKFYQYFGVNLRTTGPDIAPPVNSIERSVGWCVRCNPDMFGQVAPEYVNLGEFASRMTRGMRTGMPHPDFSRKDSGCFVRTGLGNETTGSGFTGFVFQYAWLPVDIGDFQTYTPADDWKIKNGGHLTIEDDGTKATITCEADTPSSALNNNVCWGNKYPVSHMGGYVEFNISNLFSNTGAHPEGVNSDFQLGIVRGIPGNDGDQSKLPFMNPIQDRVSRNQQGYDYVFSVQQRGETGNRFLRLGHFVADESEGVDEYYDPRKPLRMEQIDYYKDEGRDDYNGGGLWRKSIDGAVGYIPGGNDAYNMSTNIQKLDKFRFLVKNERVDFECWSTTGGTTGPNHTAIPANTWVLLASYHNVGAHQAQVQNIPKPSGITTWNMYPKVLLTKSGTSVDVIQKSRNTNSVQNNPDRDWYCRMMREGEGRLTLDVDSRYMYQVEENPGGEIYNQLSYEETDGIGYLYDYVPILIVGDGAPQYIPTSDANMASILGFNSHSVLDDTYAFEEMFGNNVQYVNDTQPDLLDYGSMFVRLDNFTQKSYNAGTGRPSKILYHMPRFDTSNRDIGSALYFEPQQRSYVKFNNPDKLTLNELNISFCDNQERLVEDLVGQTIVVLHIRPSSSPLGKM